MSKNIIEPSIILTIRMDNPYNIPIIITDKFQTILYMNNIVKGKSYNTRMKLVQCIKNLIEEYNIDTLLLEENKLMINTFSKYPDPYILQNILLGFEIQITLENEFWNTIKYILEIPNKDWLEKVLDKNTIYCIGAFKQHIRHRYDFDESTIDKIESNNYYKTICFSESVQYNSLMSRKYQVNKG